MDRLLYVQANEAARCLDEGVVLSVADANVGSVLGWGFAPFLGGVLQFVNHVGPARFVERSRDLAVRHGARFEPAAAIVRLVTEGRLFEAGGPA
jgi:3-hydroxyacyl-CoA dehydrogenase / enoyl-CoA hydratase / 3-hydroxybutyryl-CoA epimerase